MKKEITISNNKTLKLTNVVQLKLDLEKIEEWNQQAEQLNNYILSKGVKPIGPIIQALKIEKTETGEPVPVMYFYRQADNFIHKMDEPYTIQSVIRVPNCMYSRYIGPEEKVKLAYDKLNVTAFEEDIELNGNSYTIYVGQDEENDTITADVFMERADS